MRKLLISLISIATLLASAGCSNDRIAEKMPFVYRIDIQQGNVITQEMVNRLEPGMDRRQVQFVLGTPMTADPFHQDRWDYVYSFRPGGGDQDTQRVTVLFVNDGLFAVEGDLRPEPPSTDVLMATSKQMTVTVPYQEPQRAGILSRMWRWIAYGGDKDGSRAAADQER